MKTLIALAALAAFVVGPAVAQTATQSVTDAVTKAATDAATKAATDSVNKAVGVENSGGKKAKADKAKDGPNYGRSLDHRQDGEHGHKGKKKNK
jgi:hypothetical protein